MKINRMTLLGCLLTGLAAVTAACGASSSATAIATSQEPASPSAGQTSGPASMPSQTDKAGGLGSATALPATERQTAAPTTETERAAVTTPVSTAKSTQGPTPLPVPTPKPTPIPTPSPSPEPAKEPTEQVINVKASFFKWEPDQTTVKVGVPVHFRVTSTEGLHGFSIEGTNVIAQVGDGETKDVTWTPKQAGEYTIRCNVYCGDGHVTMMVKITVA